MTVVASALVQRIMEALWERIQEFAQNEYVSNVPSARVPIVLAYAFAAHVCMMWFFLFGAFLRFPKVFVCCQSLVWALVLVFAAWISLLWIVP